MSCSRPWFCPSSISGSLSWTFMGFWLFGKCGYAFKVLFLLFSPRVSYVLEFRFTMFYMKFDLFMNLYTAHILIGEWNNFSRLWLSSYCRLELGRKLWKCYYRVHTLLCILNNWCLIVLTRLIIWFYFSTIHLAIVVFFPWMHSQICNLSIIHDE